MPRVLVDRDKAIKLFYEEHGEGDPVVLIHGWPMSSRSWEPQLPALVDAGHRVITYDRRGFGLSSQPWSGYDFDTFAADLDALMTHLDLRNATLVGFSMGGGEVVRYLARYGSDRVSRIVLAASVTPYMRSTADNPNGGMQDSDIDKMLAAIEHDRIDFVHEFTKDFFAPSTAMKQRVTHGSSMLVSEAQRRYAETIASFASAKGTRDCVKVFSSTDFRGDLAKVNVPALVIHGDADRIVPYRVSGKRTHTALSGSRIELIEGAPHGCNLTHKEQFNRALLSFIPAGIGARAASMRA